MASTNMPRSLAQNQRKISRSHPPHLGEMVGIFHMLSPGACSLTETAYALVLLGADGSQTNPVPTVLALLCSMCSWLYVPSESPERRWLSHL